LIATGPWRPPFQQRYTRTSPFGRRYHPIYKQWRLHTGQDLTSLSGAGPVVAASSGTVVSARNESVYGHIVTLRHGGGIRTRYGHLASIDPKIQSGATVTIGQRLGVEGSTGTSTGLHLHFQVEINGRPVDPVPFMADRGAPLNGKLLHPTLRRRRPPPSPFRVAGPTEAGGFGYPHPVGRDVTRCTIRRCPSRPRSKSCTSPQPPGTRSPGPCWPASAWKKPATAATTAPAPPAPKD
jgi:hypothetical protein